MIRYDPHSWTDHLFDIRGTLLLEISVRVATCMAWAAGVVWFHLHVRPVAIPVTIHTLVGVALGLLLVFRTNASYDRYWEGRKVWASIVNGSRNLVRSARPHLQAHPDIFFAVVRWTAVFPYAVMSSLRGDAQFGPAEADLPATERVSLRAAQHLALHSAQQITDKLSEALHRSILSEKLYTTLDLNVQTLVDALGGCERIRNTPLPFAYTIHLRRALVIYCFTLPFALVDTFGWSTVLTVALVAYTYFGIEEIGVEIEGPFGHDENDLPLEDLCSTILSNLYATADLAMSARDVNKVGL
jgi:ion channel-forming bestrophin family protein